MRNDGFCSWRLQLLKKTEKNKQTLCACIIAFTALRSICVRTVADSLTASDRPTPTMTRVEDDRETSRAP